jgi:hypothetical protein
MNKENVMKWVLAGMAVAAGALVAPGAASADFALTGFGGSMTQNGVFARQAGAHVDLTTRLTFPSRDNQTILDENVRSVDVDLPPGLVGNPTAVPTCRFTELTGRGGSAVDCPVDSQIGVTQLGATLGGGAPIEIPVYNIERPVDKPALFAFNYLGNPIALTPFVRSSDFGISVHVGPIPQVFPVLSTELTLWAVPADPSHDAQRYYRGAELGTGASSTARRAPFLTNGTNCSDTPAVTTARVSSWQHPDVFTSASFSADFDGVPFVNERCDRLEFAPEMTAKPTSRMADAPTGLDVDVTVPQNDTPDGLATAHVRRVSVTLPQGMSVSSSSATGLGACAPSEIGLGTDAEPTCPESATIGSVSITSPLLDVPLKGSVILAKQNDNPFRSLLAMYLVAKGPGILIKLPGKIDANPDTGQLVATFDNNPQVPFTTLHFEFRSGAQAPLATPTACGTYNTHAEITSWASDKVVAIDTPMVIDQGCGPRDVAPSLSAGFTNPQAGGSSPFTLALTRADRTQFLSRLIATIPSGILADVASAPRCPSDLAALGACPPESRVGTVTTAAGPGAEPLSLTGQVYFTGPYGDAPFGLSIVVPTAGQAGPFDLGNVVVRAGIYVDRTDAHVTVKSDPFPRIIQGIQLRLRQVKVTIDRPGFMLSPTSCKTSNIGALVEGTEGAQAFVSVPFQAIGCGELDVLAKLSMRFTNRNATKDGDHPGVQARVAVPKGGTNLAKVTVKLPLSVALDPDNAQALCKPEERAKLACPKGSIVGRARAKSVLPDVLEGPVYFVEGKRKSKTGRIISTYPNLWIPLSADGVTIDVNATSNVDSLQRLVTTFDKLPDAPISSFSLDLTGGKHGILVVSGKPGTCQRDKSLDSQMVGQNGKVLESTIQVAVDGCKKLSVVSSNGKKGKVTLRVSALAAGKVRLSGAGIASRSLSVRAGRVTSITSSLTAGMRSTLHRKGKVSVKVKATYVPKKGKSYSVTKAVTVRR